MKRLIAELERIQQLFVVLQHTHSRYMRLVYGSGGPITSSLESLA
jgi:hypothetical protein